MTYAAFVGALAGATVFIFGGREAVRRIRASVQQRRRRWWT
jgi:hypothetical protein